MVLGISQAACPSMPGKCVVAACKTLGHTCDQTQAAEVKPLFKAGSGCQGFGTYFIDLIAARLGRTVNLSLDAIA